MSSYSDLVLSVQESKTLAITALIKKLKAEGKDVLSFSAGEPDFPTPEYIKEAAMAAISSNFTYYTANEGYADLVKAIIQKFKNDNALEFEPKNIIVSNGAKHSIYNLLMALCNPGDEVIFQSPYWVSYPEMVTLAQAKSVIIPADVSTEFKVTPEQLKAAITLRTKVFLLNSPSNPTGAVYTEDEIRALAEVLKGTGIWIISDEIYERITFDGYKHFSIGSLPEVSDQTITVNGVSKAYSMTGWRIGYAGGPEKVIKLARNLQSHSTSNASSISQVATKVALEKERTTNDIKNMVEQFNIRRDYVVKRFNEIEGVVSPIPHGAFYVFPDFSAFYGKSHNGFTVTDSTTLCQYLLTESLVGLVPGAAFGADNCARLSYACSLDQLEKGIVRISEGLSKLK